MRAIRRARISSAAMREDSSSWFHAVTDALQRGLVQGSGWSRKARFNCMTALLTRHRLDASAAESVDDLAQVKQIAKSAEIVAATTVIVRRRSPGLFCTPIGPLAGMSDRLPSGKTARTRRTPRRRMLLITASDWPSKAWRSRMMVTEFGISR